MGWRPMLEVQKRGLGTLTDWELPDTAELRGLSSGALFTHCLALWSGAYVGPAAGLGVGFGTGAE